MTTPDGNPDILQGARFPRTREEAEKIANELKVHLRADGCRCPHLQIEFVESSDRRKPSYICVQHEPLCLMAYGHGNN